jgi:heat shock protein HslJ
VVAEARVPTDGAQVPLPFEFWVPSERAGTFAGAVAVGPGIDWAAEPVAVPGGAGPVGLGTLVMERVAPMGFSSRMICGEQEIEVGFVDDHARMRVGETVVDVFPVPAASGARYEAPDDPGTFFWSRGETALVGLAGETLPECTMVAEAATSTDVAEAEPAPAPEAAPEPEATPDPEATPEPQAPPEATEAPTGPDLRAVGNEPGWSAVIDGGTMTLQLDYGARQIEAPAPEPEPQNGATVYRLPEEDIALTIEDTLCADTMSGMPFPQTATLALPDATLPGCAGDSRSLLEGPEWTVETIGDEPVEAGEVTISFLPEGRVAGSGGCNRFIGDYTLTGESLSIGPLGVTMMACPEDQMATEQRFLDTVEAVNLFAIGNDGALVLLADERPAMVARR